WTASEIWQRKFSTGRKIRWNMIQQLRQVNSKYQLNEFESIELIRCSVSNLFNYTPTSPTKLRSIYELYEVHTGNCTEMSEVALDLATSLGLLAKMSHGGGHAHVRVLVNGNWYIIGLTANHNVIFQAP